MEGRVARIAIAPVKALHVVEKDEVELGFTGVAGDRRFWMVDADGRLVNDKRHPQLLRLRAEWDEATRELGLEFPDGRLVVFNAMHHAAALLSPRDDPQSHVVTVHRGPEC